MWAPGGRLPHRLGMRLDHYRATPHRKTGSTDRVYDTRRAVRSLSPQHLQLSSARWCSRIDAIMTLKLYRNDRDWRDDGPNEFISSLSSIQRITDFSR